MLSRIQLSALGAWGALGAYRGEQWYRHKLALPGAYLYTHAAGCGALGAACYLNPFLLLPVWYKESLRLECNLRGLQYPEYHTLLWF
jgi:hypothetical protein